MQIRKGNQKFFLVGIVKNGGGQSDHVTLKLTVPQERIDGMNGSIACRCKFRKAHINDFWVGTVKIGCGRLVYEILKFAVS